MMNHCKYDAQGFLKCENGMNKKPKVNEGFVENPNDVQCGYFTHYSQAKDNCEMCCAMNGLVWKGKQSDYYSMRVNDRSASNELRTYCKCNSINNIKINANQHITADPARLSQYNKKVWSVGTRDLASCIDKCVSSDVCKWAVLQDKECWLSDLDLAYTITTPKTGVISIKKSK